MKYSFKNFNALLIVTALATSNIFSGAAFAATQGTLGATSTGSVAVSVTKAIQARISGLSDLTLAGYTVGDAAPQLTSDVCIYSSTGGNYTVTASGSGAASAFTIASGANTIAYTLAWNSGGAGSLTNTGTALVTTVASTTLANGSTTSSDCVGGTAPTARLILNISTGAMDAAPASSTAYTGTVTLLITPA